jgi:hypothetical protein
VIEAAQHPVVTLSWWEIFPRSDHTPFFISSKTRKLAVLEAVFWANKQNWLTYSFWTGSSCEDPLDQWTELILYGNIRW